MILRAHRRGVLRMGVQMSARPHGYVGERVARHVGGPTHHEWRFGGDEGHATPPVVVSDGVFYEAEDGRVRFHPTRAPRLEDIEALVATVAMKGSGCILRRDAGQRRVASRLLLSGVTPGRA